MSRERLIPALVVASTLGVGLLVLQRWVAETKFAAIVLVAAWFGIVALVSLIAVRTRPELRLPVLGTYIAILVATVAIGYVTGFRDTMVDEDVVMAAERVPEAERDSALAGDSASAFPGGEKDEPEKPTAPVELAQGAFTGADGHAGTGVATIVRDPDGNRTLTFTDFDVDPGAKTVVWLSPGETEYKDRFELGSLKGNVGDQRYAIPEDADLRKYDTVILYCTPFTVRIAVAPLG